MNLAPIATKATYVLASTLGKILANFVIEVKKKIHSAIQTLFKIFMIHMIVKSE